MERYYFTVIEDGYFRLGKVTTNPDTLANESEVFYEDTDLLNLDYDEIINCKEYPIYNGDTLEVIDEDNDKHTMRYEDPNDEYAYYDLFEELCLCDSKVKKAIRITYNKGIRSETILTNNIIELYKKYLNE